MGKKILYITNYYLDDVIKQRNSAPYISQAGQNKSAYMIQMLRAAGHEVTVWSNAWTKSTSFRYYRGFRSKLDSTVYYASILGIPFLNVWTCKQSCKRFLDEQEKKNHFDVIVFYNMRLENAPVALYAQKKYGTKIVLQYEDGLTKDAGIHGIRKWLYRRMEQRTMPRLDGAFLVNGKLDVPCPSVVVRGALSEPQNSVTEECEAEHHVPKCCASEHRVPRLLFAGTLDEQRGIGVLLAALSHTDQEFELQVTGKGPLAERVRQCKDPRVKMLGFLSYEEYQKVLAKADICINAQLAGGTFGNYSFPSKLYEYLSCHKLIVSSNVADVREALAELAFIYEGDSAGALARQIDRAIAVWRDPSEKAAYDEAITQFIDRNSMDEIAKQTNQMLARL